MLSKTKIEKNLFSLKITAIFFVITLAVVFLLPHFSFAQEINIDTVANSAGLSVTSPEVVIGNIIKWVLGILGAIGLIIVIIAGFIWMTSGGNEEKISKAKKMMVAALIGIAIILASYIIVSFILKSLKGVVNGNGETTTTQNNVIGGFGKGALGGGLIEYHYPDRDATNIARNTMIMANFKVAVATSSVVGEAFSSGVGQSLCEAYTNNNTNGSACGKLSEQIEIRDSVINNNAVLDPDKFVAVLDSTGKNVLIDPISNLGSDQRNSQINVALTQSMKSADGKDLFSGLNSGYDWKFEVSTFVDTTPPKVTSVWPRVDTTVARNAIIKVTFSEPINILSINNHITVSSTSGIIPGSIEISNQFKTIEFLSSSPCGEGGESVINSCGETVFCLPRSSTIETILKSGSGSNPISGISDASGNFLDGDIDGTAGGDFSWIFNTSDTINLTPPKVTAITPDNDSLNNQINTDISATFDSELLSSSLKSDNFYIYNYDICDSVNDDGKKETISQSASGGTRCFPNYSVSMGDNGRDAKMNIGSPYLEIGNHYRPRLTSKIKDSYGNCFYDALGVGRATKESPSQR